MGKKIAVLGVFLGCAVTGCTIGPKYHPPVTQPPAAYKEPPAPALSAEAANDEGAWTLAQPEDAKIRGDWWQIFNEPELNALEDQLNIDNQNIRISFENYMEARSLIGEARAAYYPTATAVPSFSRSKSSTNLTNSPNANTGKTSSLFTLPLDVSWAPDLWGRVRNAVHAAQYNAQLSAADLENERLIEQASLAVYFFQIRGQDALIKLYADTYASDLKALQLAQALYETGITDQISVVEAQNTLETVQSEATNLAILRAQYEHAIAVLIGKPAPAFSIPARPFTTAPPPIPIGMPSLLLERRPDVAAAERAMASANAELGVAYTAYYPNLTLSAAGGTESSAVSHLLDWPSRFWSIGPSISQPVFHAGLSATLHQYVAIYNADLATYRQTVLTAFQQVEDYLSATRLLSIQIQQQQRVVASSQQALNLELVRYQTGLDPFVDVVTLQNTLLSNQQALTSLQVSEMMNAVSLVEALGGGWDKSQLPTPSEVTANPPKADTRIQQ